MEEHVGRGERGESYRWLVLCPSTLTDSFIQPYVEKHQADKKRAEEAKEAYEVSRCSLITIAFTVANSFSPQSKSKKAATAGSGDEDDE